MSVSSIRRRDARFLILRLLFEQKFDTIISIYFERNVYMDRLTELMPKSCSSDLILACGGRSERMGENKLLMDIGGKPCILRACEAFDKCKYIERIIVSAPTDMQNIYGTALREINKPVIFVESGATRQESVLNAVKASNAEIICIHDGARPLISVAEIEKSIEDAYTYGSSIMCVPVKETIRLESKDESYSPPRDLLYQIKTPQSFSMRLYLYAVSMAKGDYTDDAQLLDAAGIRPHMTLGSYSNIKLTTMEDYYMINGLLHSKIRVGHGYDVHRLTDNRRLILGGVDIPYEKGLLGHSDADVLTHAVMDSLLGAAAMGDIGKLFPDSSPEYAGADSIGLLKEVVKALHENKCDVVNIDATVIAQAPKLSPYIDEMRKKLSDTMQIDVSDVSVKATTEERLGFTGSGEGIAAHCVALIERHI